MATVGETLEVPELGFRAVVRETGGERLVIDVIGRPRGFIGQEHVHARQVERHEVIAGVLRLQIAGKDHLLRAGEVMEVPAGTPHRQLPGDPDEGHVRVTVEPAGSTLRFIERLAELSRTGRLTRRGYPRPLAAAELVRDFGAEGHASRPPLAVQQGIARALLAVRPGEYMFVDEWHVAAPPEAVHAALADARSYPDWWKPVYLGVEADGPARVGGVSHQHFKGRLPYHLRTRSRIVRLEPPRIIEAEVDGDLRGRGLWTLTPDGGGTHVRFDWRVFAERPLLRALTPVLRPALRWNHNWAIARAREGLEPYALAQ